ncbi:hypothetical protein [Clostridium sp. B9]|uniref:hypothetical protein n=1 Tax=Clostridium sp. B9 TaxID=3423224 RepID=UPI003D2F045F
MRKTVSVLVLIGILSSTFIGCGFNKEAKRAINEDEVITFNNETKKELDSEEFNNDLERLVEEDDIKGGNNGKVLKEPTRIEIVVSKSLDSDEEIDISSYNLTPDESMNVFYRKDQEGLIKQKEVHKFLMDKYGDAGLDTFVNHKDEVDQNIKDVKIYIEKPKENIEPAIFIGKIPIYEFRGWLGNKTTMYVNYRGDAETADTINLAFKNGYLYRIKDGEIIKVVDMPRINDDESIIWNK